MHRSAARWLVGLLGVAILTASEAQAQRGIEIETRVGAAFAKFTGDLTEAHSKTGLAGGFAVHLPLFSVFSFQPELQYVSKGNSYGTLTDPVLDGIPHYGVYNQIYAL